jgi:hypothetical protein
MVVTFALAALLFAWLWSRDDERTAIAELPNAERTNLYARTRANLQTTCKSNDRGLRAYCEQQARFILKFPECDANCQLLASQYLPEPTR